MDIVHGVPILYGVITLGKRENSATREYGSSGVLAIERHQILDAVGLATVFTP